MDTEKLNAKDYLNRVNLIDKRIDAKLEQVLSLRDLATKATATLSDMPRDPSPNHHRMEDFITKAMDLESEINADLKELIDLKREVATIIKCVERTELQTVLEMRYLCNKTWEDIAVTLHYELRHIHRLHGIALEEVDLIRRHS